ncbi:MAG: galactokinase, partial [Actinobacteria bacterium]|nr:galactokinase [Actinomycetota bacterium]
MSKIDREFVHTFAETPDVIAAAPGRVNLIGEHIDYSDGYVLPFAIADRTYAAIRKRSDRLIRIASTQRRKTIITINLDDINPQLKGQWERYVLSVIWAMEINKGVDVMIDGHVPLGAGLSSSAALECSVATALNDLFSLGFDLETLARLTQKGENQYVGVPCGIMDQSVSLMAKSGSALLLDCRDLTSRHVVFDVASSGLELLIIDTQTHHSLTDGGYAERRASCDSVVSKLGIRSMRELTLEKLENSKDVITATEFIRARHAVSEIARVIDAVAALESKNFQELGL